MITSKLLPGRAAAAARELRRTIHGSVLAAAAAPYDAARTARYLLHPLPSVLAGLIMFPLAQAATVLHGYAEIAAGAPDELTVMCGFLGTGDQRLLFLFPAWSGDPAHGQDAITRLLQLGTPVTAQVAPMPY